MLHRLILKIKSHPASLLFCLGCLSGLAMAPTYMWGLMVVGYSSLFYYTLNSSSWKKTAILVFSFFLGYFLTCFYWISNSLFVDFETWWWALPFAFAGLPVGLSLLYTPLITLTTFINNKVIKSLTILFALTLSDWLRGHILTGFPWNFPVHTWANHDFMMSLLPNISFYGLNALTITLFCLVGILSQITSKNIRTISYLLCGLVFTTLFWTPDTVKTIKNSNLPQLLLVQANIPQNKKWDPDYIQRNFDRYVDMTRHELETAPYDFNKPILVLWPETAIASYHLNAPQFVNNIKEILRLLPKDSLLITGYLNQRNNNFYNSIAFIDKNAEVIAQYDKHHLVPFGEYMPLNLDTITGFNNFSNGPKPQLIRFSEQNLNILPLICYEIIFSRYSKVTTGGSIIINLTNDAWFGTSAGPYQHFDQARFRAVETQNTVIRLSGNGFSGIIDKNNNLILKTPLNQKLSFPFTGNNYQK